MTHWTQKDGTKIALTEMTPQHIVNTVKMLARQMARAQTASGCLCAELIRRGDLKAMDSLANSRGDAPDELWDSLIDDFEMNGCDRYGSLQ